MEALAESIQTPNIVIQADMSSAAISTLEFNNQLNTRNASKDSVTTGMLSTNINGEGSETDDPFLIRQFPRLTFSTQPGLGIKMLNSSKPKRSRLANCWR
jgi:hypothetical protein